SLPAATASQGKFGYHADRGDRGSVRYPGTSLPPPARPECGLFFGGEWPPGRACATPMFFAPFQGELSRSAPPETQCYPRQVEWLRRRTRTPEPHSEQWCPAPAEYPSVS